MKISKIFIAGIIMFLGLLAQRAEAQVIYYTDAEGYSCEDDYVDLGSCYVVHAYCVDGFDFLSDTCIDYFYLYFPGMDPEVAPGGPIWCTFNSEDPLCQEDDEGPQY